MRVKAKHSKPGRDKLDEGIRVGGTDVTIAFLESRRVELGNAGFAILHGMVDPW